MAMLQMCFQRAPNETANAVAFLTAAFDRRSNALAKLIKVWPNRTASIVIATDPEGGRFRLPD